eukprot:GSChrysophyteH1.ASY1.ANO1.419.1 assembled CDS
MSGKKWSKERKLTIAIILSLIFCLVEVAGGIYAKSLAIISDAAHLLTDIMGFGISLAAVVVARWAPSESFSFGFKRAEVVGALGSVIVIWILTGWLLLKAFERLYNYYDGTMKPIDGKVMSAVALFGILTNICIALVFADEHGSGFSFHSHDHGHGHSHEHTHNSPAYMHVMTDLITGVGVLFSGLAIWYDERLIVVDPICTLIFAVLVIQSTMGIINRIMSVLFEGVPEGVDYFEVKRELENMDGVQGIHHLHIWSVSTSTNCLSCHMAVSPSFSEHGSPNRAGGAKNICSKHKIQEVTIQIEDGQDDCPTHDCDPNCNGPQESRF